MSWTDIIKILGIVSTVLLVTAFVLGYFKLKIKDRVKVHKWAGIAAVAVGLAHAGIIFYRTYFMNGFERFFNP